MTFKPDPADQVERVIHETLRALPARRAPRSLEERVLAEIERRANLPWWRQSFVHWPIAARAGFGVISLALVRLAFLVGARMTAGFEVAPWRASLNSLAAWVEQGRAVVQALAGFVEIMERNIPPLWLYGGLVLMAVLYATLWGVGAAAYRTIQTHR